MHLYLISKRRKNVGHCIEPFYNDFFFADYSVELSKKQLSILILEKSKPKHEKLSWHELSKVLNSEGPYIKKTNKWKEVNIKKVQ